MLFIHRRLSALFVGMLLLLPGLAAAQELPPGSALIHPILEDVDPETVLPGEEVSVSGTGGFIEFEDNSTDKSPRAFTLAFDGVPLDVLECADDLCSGSLIVPQDTTPGVHTISETGGGSTLEVTVEVPPQEEPPPPPHPRLIRVVLAQSLRPLQTC